MAALMCAVLLSACAGGNFSGVPHVANGMSPNFSYPAPVPQPPSAGGTGVPIPISGGNGCPVAGMITRPRHVAIVCTGGSSGSQSNGKYNCDQNTGWGCNPSPVCQADYAKDQQMAPQELAATLYLGGITVSTLAMTLTGFPGVMAWAVEATGLSSAALTTAGGLSAITGYITSNLNGMGIISATQIEAQYGAVQQNEARNNCLNDGYGATGILVRR